MSNEYDDFHRWYGKHSNIPDCCISMWVTCKDKYSFFIHARNVRKIEKAYNIRWHYMPCVICLKNRIIHQVHICNKDCKVQFPYKKKICTKNDITRSILINNIINQK